MERKTVALLVKDFGRKYSDVLGIDLKGGGEKEVFKWFLASILFGAPIRESSAVNTYRCFEEHKVLTPRKIRQADWKGLVEILDDGGYTRYDFKTADKLLQVMGNLTEQYEASLSKLYQCASDAEDLEKRLKSLGKGIGDVTINIFLRELRFIWKKANPKPTPLVVLAAKNLGIASEESPKEILREMKRFWRENKSSGKTFVNFETALLRVGKDFCRKKRCEECRFRQCCLTVTSA
ncbi:MAG: hypothetical protein U9O89_01830 [Thermoproteota archaeon]|nr:hypothetical protein [Thermoproteota archaeon]